MTTTLTRRTDPPTDPAGRRGGPGGRFKVVRELGEGGYSFVLLVKADDGACYAAKKVLCQTSEQLAAAKHEIAMLEKFQHPRVLPLLAYDFGPGFGPSGNRLTVAYFLTPAYEEGSLVDYVERVKAAGGRLALAEVLSLCLQVCEALGCLHGNSPAYAHRDVKPHNILVEHSAGPAPTRAVLMDFGSVRRAEVAVTTRNQAVALQEDAEAHCTAAYRAPELFDVPSDCVVDARIDVWSLGCTLYYLAYGESPFEYAGGEAGGSIALAVMSGKVEWPAADRAVVKEADLATLRPLIEYCLERDPRARPTCDEVVLRVEQIKFQAAAFSSEPSMDRDASY